MRGLWLYAALIGCTMAVPALGQKPDLDDAPAIKHHRLAIGNLQLAYTARWDSLVLADASGVPEATISATSYILDGVRDKTKRPIAFAWNGGPGASSSPLKFGLLGPFRMGPEGAARAFMPGDAEPKPISVQPNRETLLDAADLVFIDPVGTGYSRELSPHGMKTYFTPPGDVLAIERYIRSWLEREGRTASPVYIIGESYGGFRAGLLAGRISDLDVRGVVLVSPGLDLRDRGDLDFVTLLPSLAVAALARNRITPRGRSVEEVFAEARAFAEGEYAAALQRGNRVTESERARIAERMAALIGVPKEKILAANLRFTETEFAGEAVPGKLVSLLDSRVSAPMPLPTAGRDNASSDPTLAMGASNIKTSPDIARYLREQVGLKINRPYVSLSLDVNFNFNWQPSSQSFEANRGWVSGKGLATLMKRRPKARLLVTGGYYDLATPLMRTFYDVDHLDVPADQVEQLALAAGHASYSTDDERRQMSAALHRFIADGAAR